MKSSSKGKGEEKEEQQIISLDQMIVSPLIRKKLFNIAQMLVARETTLQGYRTLISLEKSFHYKSSSTSQRLSLPNILIIGPPGTGKSFAATSLARHSGLPYLSLCAGDILAVSPTLSSPSASSSSSSSSSSTSSTQYGGPGGLLRDVLESASKANNKKGFLVILDDADALIANRKRVINTEGINDTFQSQKDSKRSSEEASIDCVHILLHRLRVNTPSLGTLITTSMELNKIDAALLDR